MKIKHTYVILEQGKYQLLFECQFGEWFKTSNGIFGQREWHLEPITKSIAMDYILTSPKFINVENIKL